ncbi:hypothetical protein [Clostridium sp.]|uniref:hypothetical protein n=1 Tax=Clostridium sp. TaxID=1506 RepID=UPI00257C8B5E|nr:hypothetical protein [Clostridium sp.]MBS4842566.1 hypothetical protein [Clostridium sp.]MDU1403571.1 hypothetical protein [Clostridium sp.]MDU4927418.1 hypothetical protein [Clostridium sp.]
MASDKNQKEIVSIQKNTTKLTDKVDVDAIKDEQIRKSELSNEDKIINQQKPSEKKSLNTDNEKETNDTHKQLEMPIEEKSTDKKVWDKNSKKVAENKSNYVSSYNKGKSNSVMYNSISPGTLLEYRIKRLVFNLGYYPRMGIDLKTSYDDKAEKITDLDVYGIYIHKDFTMKTIWADCKSGGVKIHDRLSWIKGVKGSIQINDVILVAGGVRTSVKQYARKFEIQILDLKVIQKLEDDYGIDSNDWRGSWNPDTQNNKVVKLSRINIPTNDIYKRISKFISSDYWVMDNYSKCKKAITALRELSALDSIPMSADEMKSVKWGIFELVGMFLLAILNISKEVYYFTDGEKMEIINEGLSSGDIPNQKRAELIDAAFRVAYSSLKSQIADFQIPAKMPTISLNPPNYASAFCDLILRITNKPIYFFDILRFIDFTLMEYDLNDKPYDEEALRKIFNNYDNVIIGSKTLLHFICHTANIPRTLFSLLK